MDEYIVVSHKNNNLPEEDGWTKPDPEEAALAILMIPDPFEIID